MRVIINGSAGTAIGMSHEQLAGMIERPLKARGHDVELAVITAEQLQSAIEQAAGSDVDAIVIGGGDGSVRCAAIAIQRTDKALGVLPLGTMNLLARDLGLPLDLAGAVEALGVSEPTNIDMARVNDRYFLCASIMGLVTQYSAERQKLRGKPWYVRLPAYVSVIHSLLQSRHRMAIAVDDGGKVEVIRALSVAICSNDYDETSGMMLKRSQLDGETLTLYAAKHRSGAGMFYAIARMALGFGRNDPRIATLRANKFTITTRRKYIWLANDGELEKVATPIVYSVLPGALKVLKPRASEPSVAPAAIASVASV